MASTLRLLAITALVAAGTLLLTAGPASSGPGTGRAVTAVKVTMSDYAFALSKKTVRKGMVVFSVGNKGNAFHDFKIGGKKTPIYATGKSGSLNVVFRKVGRYPYICTVPGHAAAGMKGVLTVVP